MGSSGPKSRIANTLGWMSKVVEFALKNEDPAELRVALLRIGAALPGLQERYARVFHRRLNPVGAKKGTRILIRWLDACNDESWLDRESQEKFVRYGPAKCSTIGTVIHVPTEQEPYWTVARTVCHTPTGRMSDGVITIPCGCVQEVERLRQEGPTAEEVWGKKAKGVGIEGSR